MSSTEKPNSKRLRVVSSSSDETPSQVAESTSTETGACPHCFGTGMEVVPGVGARRCRCQSPDHHHRLLNAARIPRRYQDCTIQNYLTGDSQVKSVLPEKEFDNLTNTDAGLSKWKAKTEADRIINDYLVLDGRGLLFVGPVGVGKTHLAVAILNELINRYHVRGLFYQFGALLKEIQGSYNTISETSELNVLKPVFEAEVLVLDELGSQKMTDWVKETLMYIINSRYNDKRLTIFTSNYGDDPNIQNRISKLNRKLRELQNVTNQSEQEAEAIIKKIRSLSEGTLEERIGTPLRSRLYEMCKDVIIEGEDYRKTMAAPR